MIRLAAPDDAEQIRQIYNPEVLESTVTFDLVPRSLADQLAWLANRSGVHPAVVAVSDDVIIGFGALSPYKERAAYSTSVEDSVYVHRDFRGTGVGSSILGDLVLRAGQHGFHAVFARIVAHHSASIELHRAYGFEIVGTEVEVGRKFGKWLDVTIMQRLLTSS